MGTQVGKQDTEMGLENLGRGQWRDASKHSWESISSATCRVPGRAGRGRTSVGGMGLSRSL